MRSTWPVSRSKSRVSRSTSPVSRSLSPVSRPAWVSAVNALTGTGGTTRKSPIEIFADAASVVTRSPYAGVTGIKSGKLGRWTDGVAELRADRTDFAVYWDAHNDRLLTERSRAIEKGDTPGPLWVVLGDSTAQGLGAPGPRGGYVGQTLQQLRRTTGMHWRVLNLSVSGALIRDVLNQQLPRAPASASLVTCGIGFNDILYTGPGKLFTDLRALLAAVPDRTVMLDLPVPAGYGGLLGLASRPYVARINRTIHQAATARGLPVAEVSRHFLPPWAGKFASDCFHPSQDGYRDWTRAVLAAI